MKTVATIFHSLHSERIVKFLRAGASGVIPTDTLYGISCSALNKLAVERAYEVRRRDTTKQFIILIASLDTLAFFGIRLSRHTRKTLEAIWPAPVSIIFPCPLKKFTYLHRGTKSLAFRMPDSEPLRALLKKTGPLITTSVNPEGKKPAETIAQARRYFGNNLDFYVDDRKKNGAPSALIRIEKDCITVLR